jgi:hypothetical protein
LRDSEPARSRAETAVLSNGHGPAEMAQFQDKSPQALSCRLR